MRAKYIGEDHAEIRNGKIYEIKPLKDDSRTYAVKDDSKEWYAYSKKMFKVIEEKTAAN